MLSCGTQEDWIIRQRNLSAAKAQLETAKVDPHFFGTVKSDRIAWYQREVDKWREVVG